MAHNDATNADAEFAAMHTVYSALSPLDHDARVRVISYIASRLEIAAPVSPFAQQTSEDDRAEEEGRILQEEKAAPKYGTFAELYDAAQPTSNGDKALVAGYWIQVCEGADSFDAQSANKALKNLGHGLPNITSAIDVLKGQKPALTIQLKKSGKSQQARKVYKVTVAGIKLVEQLING